MKPEQSRTAFLLVGDRITNPPVTIAKRFDLKIVSMLALFLSAGLIAIFSFYENSLPVMASYIVFGGIGLMFASRFDFTTAPIFLIVYGFSTIVAIAIYFYYCDIFGNPYYSGGTDDLWYEIFAEAFANTYNVLDYGAIPGNIVPEWYNSPGYIYLVGVLFKFCYIFGEIHTMVPRLFNILCLSLVSVGTYGLSMRLSLQRQTAVAAALFIGLLPLMMWVSVLTLRDMFVSLLLLWLVLLWSPDKRNVSKQSIIGALIFTCFVVIILSEFRRAQAYVAMTIAILGLVLPSRTVKPIFWAIRFTIILVFVGYLSFSYFETIDTETTGFFNQREDYTIYALSPEQGGGLSTVIFTTPPPLGYIYRAAYALISPMPVLFGPLDAQWRSAGVALQIIFIPFFFYGIFQALRDKECYILLGGFILLFVGMAMFTFQTRHITQYMPLAVVLAALGYERYRWRRNVTMLFMGLTILVLMILYLSLK
jgi:hypothetical protein